MHSFQVPHTLFKIFCAAALAAGVATVPSYLIAQQPYHVIAQWKIGGNGGWDYVNVDPVTHRLFIAHSTQVQVVDTTTGKLVGAIDGFQGTHGIAFDTTGKYGYISDGRGKAVVVFERNSLAKVASIAVTGSPDGIVFEPATKAVWTFSGQNAIAIDAASQKVVATVKLPSRAEAPEVDGNGYVYGNVNGNLIRIDARTKTIIATWPACDSAAGLAVDADEHRLFQACDGKKMIVLDSENGKQLGTAEIGNRPDSAGFSAKYKLAFASTGDGLLSVVVASTNGYTTIEKLPTMKGARTMIYDPSTDRVYTVSAIEAPSKSSAGLQGPPQGAPGGPGGRPSFVPDSFTVIVIGR